MKNWEYFYNFISTFILLFTFISINVGKCIQKIPWSCLKNSLFENANMAKFKVRENILRHMSTSKNFFTFLETTYMATFCDAQMQKEIIFTEQARGFFLTNCSDCCFNEVNCEGDFSFSKLSQVAQHVHLIKIKFYLKIILLRIQTSKIILLRIQT